MLNLIVGACLALALLGLPLAIIALFIASLFEKRPAKGRKGPPRDEKADHYRYYRLSPS
jgi:hypothetical protein